MIRSMTAYAAADHNGNEISAAVEMRSYNSRFLDVALRIKRKYSALEERVKAEISRRISRGRIEINVQITHEDGDLRHWAVDETRADAYHSVLKTLKERYALADGISLEMLTRAEGVVKVVEPALAEDDLWMALHPALSAALDQLLSMRKREGAALAADLGARIDTVETHVRGIQSQAADMISFYRERLQRRIGQLTHGQIEIDPLRIAQEAAFHADRSDISEELVRCRSHFEQFRAIMAAPEPAGRKLNFLLQELNRELNTIGAKAEKADIAHLVVEAKAELEKIREQVQNVE